jgi:SH3 domain protein
MKFFSVTAPFFLLLFGGTLLALPSQAQSESTPEITQSPQTGYIIDDLFIYMHSGAGKQYRIVGTVTAGSAVTLTGEKQNGFTQIITEKKQTAWVEDEYVSQEKGLRYVVAELNGQLAQTQRKLSVLQQQRDELLQKNNELSQQNQQLNQQLDISNNALAAAKTQLSTQDFELKKQWFFNGAMVLGIGLLLGLILPRLTQNRRRDTWH